MRTLLLFSLVLASACGAAPSNAAPGGEAKSSESEPYPPGKWRLGAHRLEGVMVRLSAITIAHADSAPLDELPSFIDLHATRSRDNARALALALRKRMVAGELTFAAAAAQYSSDVTSREQGGLLGNLPAHLISPEILDAIYGEPAGATSRVVETRAGFHILSRAEIGPEEVAAVDAIVVTHTDVTETDLLLRASSRSRADARRLAQTLRKRIDEDPATFAEIARTQSDFVGNARGNLGVVSTHRFGQPEQVIEAATSLEVGAVSGVIETTRGLYILRRRPDEVPQALAGSWITFSNQDGAAEEARALVAALRADARNEALMPWVFQNCGHGKCSFLQRRWTVGQHFEAVEEALLQTAVGDVATDPIETPAGIIVARRDLPGEQTDLRPRLSAELPSFDFRDRATLLSILGPVELGRYTRMLGADLDLELRLDKARSERFRALFTQTAQTLETCGLMERPQAFATLDGEVAQLLGQRDFERYQRASQKWIELKQLGM